MRIMLSNASMISCQGEMINVELMAWLEAVVLVAYWGKENVPNCEMSQDIQIFLWRYILWDLKKKVFTFYAYKSAYIHVYNNLMIKLGYLVCQLLNFDLYSVFDMLQFYIFIFRRLQSMVTIYLTTARGSW